MNLKHNVINPNVAKMYKL